MLCVRICKLAIAKRFGICFFFLAVGFTASVSKKAFIQRLAVEFATMPLAEGCLSTERGLLVKRDQAGQRGSFSEPSFARFV